MPRDGKEKFIGFVDILGYSALTKAAEAGNGLSLDDLSELTKMLGSEADADRIRKTGPSTCPLAPRIQKDVDFEIAQAWDSVVVSAEISPAGIIALVSHCWGACVQLLAKGVMCRGYIKKGMIYHKGLEVFGSGHVETVAKEKAVSFFKQDADERGTPFIEIDSDVLTYVANQPDKCVKEMFGRMVLSYNGVSALFPMKRLAHSFTIFGPLGEQFDPEQEKKANDNLRNIIKGLKTKVQQYVSLDDESAVRKANHYLRALDGQLAICDKLDRDIEKLAQPFGIRATPDVAPGLFLKR